MKIFIKLFYFIIFISNYIPVLESSTIQTTSGITTGYENKGVIYWEDIPYAMPPIGDLRWKAPRKFGNNSNYNISPKENNFCVQRPYSLGGAEGNSPYVGTEDCLYLDIFAPSNIDAKSLPVLFWIHGGGNTSGLKDLYDFSKMVSKHEVIVVRINYRLGPFGWFYHPSIQDLQNGIDKTSNFGTLDIIAALEWVNENISLFGGDQNNITIFGESAGGHNVYSLLVSAEAKGLFHKAISMSGYTTSISQQDMYYQEKETPSSNFTTKKVVDRVLADRLSKEDIARITKNEIREVLLEIPTEEFFNYYVDRDTYDEIPLTVADGIVIPNIGIHAALSEPKYLNVVPTIAGSNRDEVKLWLGTASYFVNVDYSFLGSIIGIPKVVLINEDAFEAFSYYRSTAWKIRGVDQPLNSLYLAGNEDIYAYRFDWDDHRKYIIADFKKLIGAAHATEIPLLAGDTKLVGGYPLSDLIYPPSFSKRYTSNNMMRLWTNFAKNGYPGFTTNDIEWKPYKSSNTNVSEYIIIDKKKDLRTENKSIHLSDLIEELSHDTRVNEIEKCVILLQMLTLVGNDIYDDMKHEYSGQCSRDESVEFMKKNASYIDF